MNKAVLAALAACLLALPAKAVASVTALDPSVQPGSSTTAAQAIAANPAQVTGAGSDEFAFGGAGAPSPIGIGDKTQDPDPKVLVGFPTAGDTYAILSTGQINDIASILTNDSSETTFAFTDQFVSPPAPGRGEDANDWTVLRIDVNVPGGGNCLALDYRFLSEEFPEYVGSPYNDAFIAELDTTSWATASGGEITRPNDFAVAQGEPPISVNGVGPTAMFAEEAAGTYFDAATGLVTTKTPITTGPHSIYLSVFDASDDYLDSAVFLDNLRFSNEASSTCKPPQQEQLQGPAPPAASPPAPSPSAPSNEFTLGPSVKFTGGGTSATLTVYVPGPGNLTASSAAATASSAALRAEAVSAKKKRKKKKPLLVPAKVRAKAAGPVKITIRLSGAGKKLLARKRKLTVPVTLAFTPDGGTTSRRVVNVTFKKKGKKKHKK